ncbi:uncharacterized protein I206_104417 [Kwoniella pini CBS 10737]|uniref:RING-type domain-containing protein n=1 Tax=Kwoniella pini CBS 10737 TaxID=1296096 RepID=A0AAJ8L6Z2_9TREE
MPAPPTSSSSSRTNNMSRSTPPPPYRPLSPSTAQQAALSPGLMSTSSSLAGDRMSGNGNGSLSPSSVPSGSSIASSSTTPNFSSSSSFTTPNLSTAPTSPAQSNLAARSWRPTANVPSHIHRRHRRVGSDEAQANRWLSEDEGVGSSSSGVRRRRSIGSRTRRGDDRDDHDHGDRGGDVGPSSLSGRRPSAKITNTEEAIDAINQSKRSSSSSARPIPQRLTSFDSHSSRINPSSSATVTSQPAVGTDPPRIDQLASEAGHIPLVSSGPLPDFASGNPGDGIATSVPPTSGDLDQDHGSAPTPLEKRQNMVEKLIRILGCALCPPVDGKAPSLHHPITLPCGHTLSAKHIFIPAPPSLQFTNEAAHEIHAAQQRQHQQRLSIWTNLMCPIPTCKRFSPTASASSVLAKVEVPGVESMSEGDENRSSPQRAGLLASGVHYYPPAPPPVPMPVPPPAYSSEDPSAASASPLLDVCVDRILTLVHIERKRLEGHMLGRGGQEETDVDSSSSGSEPEEERSVSPPLHASQASLSQDFALLRSSSTPSGTSTLMSRTGSKRRRGDHKSSRRLPKTSLQQGNSDEFEKELLSTLECDVCAMLLHEPVTTPCQHSFCAKCLSRSLDHSSRCPVCRQDLPSFAFFQDHAVNKVLLTIIKTAFPEEYIERQQAIERDERDSRLDTPIFVCTLAFPGMPTILHVFEPRYRLMIRRCIESTSPRFGMVLPARGTGAPELQGLMEYGTMLEIQSVQMLPDGRSMVETVGTHRFKLLEKGNLDGYTVGRIERIDDVSPEEEIAMEREAVSRATMSRQTVGPSTSASATNVSGPGLLPTGPLTSATPASAPQVQSSLPIFGAPPGLGLGLGGGQVDFAALASQAITAPASGVDDTPETTEELMAVCQAFIEQLRSGSAPWLLQRLNNTYGSMPTDPSEFSYWMALVMPIDEYEKARLLPIRSPRLRLKLIVHWVESLRSSWW